MVKDVILTKRPCMNQHGEGGGGLPLTCMILSNEEEMTE